jgi:asparagine synthase (glutamine-hydrolysing)
MGAFFLLRRGHPHFERRREALLGELAAQGFAAPKRFEAAGSQIHLYPKVSVDDANWYALSADCFCLATGTFFYRGAIGAPALERFLADFEPPTIPWDDICGQFCLIVAKRGAVHVFTDRMGLFKVYRNADGSLLSSSFLAMVAATERRTIQRQALYEYIFLGAPYGERTVFAEVQTADPDRAIVFDRSGIATRPHARIPFGFDDLSFEEALGINLANLRRYFDTVTRPFGDRVSTAITSGYDSRLILALLRERGVKPYVYVYGTENDLDVQIARRIAEGEGFPLAHTNRSAGPKVELDRFPALVEANYRFFDGYPLDGVFDNGSDVRTRYERCRDGALPLNGIGGEHFRRPDLPNRPYGVRDLVWRFYSRIYATAVTAAFSEEEYCEALERDIRRLLGTAEDPLPRSAVALLPPGLEHRYWAGRNSSINNRVGYALQPFCDLAIVRSAIRVPIAHRWYGGIQAAMIRAVDPRLAAYDSRHGFAFADPPPLKTVVREWRAAMLPPVQFRYFYSGRADELPYWLERPYIGAMLDASFPYLRRFFRIESVRNARYYNRICTLEYLFEKCSAAIE